MVSNSFLMPTNCRASKYSICFASFALSDCSVSIDFNTSFGFLRCVRTSFKVFSSLFIKASAASPQTASILRTPAATAVSEVILNNPSSPVCPTCVPPQSSTLYAASMVTTRTTSPYFSPKSAVAPFAMASSLAKD